MVALVTLLVIILVGGDKLSPYWVGFLEERPHVVARFRRPLRWLQQWWRVVFALVVLVLVGYVVWRSPEVWRVGLIAAVLFLAWWFRREIRLWGRAVLWNAIIRPARDHFGVEASWEWRGGRAKTLQLWRDLLTRVDRDSLEVLSQCLGYRAPGSNSVSLVWPRDMLRLDPVPKATHEAKRRLRVVCEDLRALGAVANADVFDAGRPQAVGVGVKLVFEGGDGERLERVDSEGEEAGGALRETLPDLTNDALQVLEVILDRYDPTSKETVLLIPGSIRLDPMAISAAEAERRSVLACDELIAGGFVTGYKSSLGEGVLKILVSLDPALRAGLVLKMIEWVEDELISRKIPLGRDRGPRVPPPPEGWPTMRVPK